MQVPNSIYNYNVFKSSWKFIITMYSKAHQFIITMYSKAHGSSWKLIKQACPVIPSIVIYTGNMQRDHAMLGTDVQKGLSFSVFICRILILTDFPFFNKFFQLSG